jgi:hypothetical protein
VSDPPRAASDVERLLVAMLADPLGARVATELPAYLVAPASLPIVHVEEAPGGAQQSPGLDVCVVDYDCYAQGRTAAKDLADYARTLILASAGYRTPDGTMWVSRAGDVRKPTILPYDDATDIRRFGGSARVWLRFVAAS